MDFKNAIARIFKNNFSYTITIGVFCFTVLPEEIFINYPVNKVKYFDETSTIILNRCLFLILLFIIVSISLKLLSRLSTDVNIKEENFKIVIEYGDIFQYTDCKKVINFDECFTVDVGDEPPKIKPSSIYGQYLQKYPLRSKEMENLIAEAGLKPERGKSQYNNQVKYKSGKIVPKDEYLLLAFAKLDSNGLGYFKRQQYIDCLFVLWEEIDKYYASKDVYIPILGSGNTRFEDESLTKQKLLDLIICSYILSPHKIQLPYKLHIVCTRSSDFFLNKIGESISLSN